jgi:hypothetical protein
MEAVDLEKLDRLFSRGYVRPLRDLHDLDRYTETVPEVIGLRHDVDDNGWDSVLPMARWENERGIRSTWYFLHSAPYWGPQMRSVLECLVDTGHEIGIHNNAIAESIRQRRWPQPILHEACEQLRGWSGAPVLSTAAHGDELCHEFGFVNYEMFAECQRPGKKYMWHSELADFGLKYAGDWLPRAAYMSDSGGKWADYPGNPTLDDALRDFPYSGRMIILQHPDHWPAELYRA